MKLYRKSVSSAGQTLVAKRRGRPPKVRSERPANEYEALDDEPNSRFYSFHEEPLLPLVELKQLTNQ